MDTKDLKVGQKVRAFIRNEHGGAIIYGSTWKVGDIDRMTKTQVWVKLTDGTLRKTHCENIEKYDDPDEVKENEMQ